MNELPNIVCHLMPSINPPIKTIHNILNHSTTHSHMLLFIWFVWVPAFLIVLSEFSNLVSRHYCLSEVLMSGIVI